MKLYVHFGLYKTGSSFLQTLLARNRQGLIEQGFYFPKSERDIKMLDGNISSGNAKPLADALLALNQKKVTQFLQERKKEAQKKKCNKLILSAESLVHPFSQEIMLGMFYQSAKDIGFSTIKAIGFIRDPVSHAISTYKHRAKSGKIRDFTSWMNNTYETMNVLKGLMGVVNKFEIEWVFRKYRADSYFMTKSLFLDFINYKIPEIPKQDKINASLSFSEIELIKTVYKYIPEIIPKLREGFKKFPIEEKPREIGLVQWHKHQAFLILNEFQSLIISINVNLPSNEKLVIKDVPDSQEMEFDKLKLGIHLSPNQLDLVIKTIKEHQNSTNRFIILLKQLKRKYLKYRN